MPTVLTRDGFRFFFYSNEGNEPPHIHVERGEATAKFWLSPPTIERSEDLSPKELKKIREIIEENELIILERWHEHFDQ